MHAEFAAQAADAYRAEARLVREARQQNKELRASRGRRSGGVRTALRSVLGLAA